MITYPRFKIAAAHIAPVFLDTDKTVAKACDVIAEAARGGAQLIAFPESFIPGFPVWAGLEAPIVTHDLFKALAASAIEANGPEIWHIRETCRRLGVIASIGFTEGTPASVGCLWNSNVLIGDDGSILNHHRKLVPTFYEKLIWANGDGGGLRVVQTAVGRIGMLICGENTNPLARYTLMAQGEQVHISSYPPVWPTRLPSAGGNYDLAEAIRIRAGAHAFEAKVFNVVSSAHVDATLRAAIEPLGERALAVLDASPPGVSMVIGPTGAPISKVQQTEEGLVMAEVDLSLCVEPKQFHDVVGYYNRFDIFKLRVDRSANRPVVFEDDESGLDGRRGNAARPEDAGAGEVMEVSARVVER